MKFETTILQAKKTATGIEVPEEIVEKLGGGKRPAVNVTINGKTYRSSIAVMGGKYMIGVSAENRALTGVQGGDKVVVELSLDSAPRELALPAAFEAALKKNEVAKKAFEALSYSKKQTHVLPIQNAKTEATRDRNIDKAITALTATK
ncbi:MAG: DUF1905 domain-containing protein [Sphingobacteriales bacterium]|nr:MAG: DUF1905 domain-containing protein [Sphingobacteriales bacterium]